MLNGILFFSRIFYPNHGVGFEDSLCKSKQSLEICDLMSREVEFTVEILEEIVKFRITRN